MHKFYEDKGVWVYSHTTEETCQEFNGKPLVPYGSYIGELPTAKEGETIVLDPDLQLVEVVQDKRGERYWREDGTSVVIQRVGETVPEGCTQNPQPTPAHTTHINGEWIFNAEAAQELFEQQIVEVDVARRELYTRQVDPLKMDYLDSTDDEEKAALQAQWEGLKAKIKTEHPWPVLLTAEG